MKYTRIPFAQNYTDIPMLLPSDAGPQLNEQGEIWHFGPLGHTDTFDTRDNSSVIVISRVKVQALIAS